MSIENRNPRSFSLDKMSAREIVRLMNEEEHLVLQAMKAVEEELALVAEKVAEAYSVGGRIIYVGAGTSGRVATMDAAELPLTFGIEEHRFLVLSPAIHLSGNEQIPDSAILDSASEDPEEDIHLAIVHLNHINLNRKDLLIAIAASGRTPYVLSALRHANQKGVWTCGIANLKKVPLITEASQGIVIDTGAEVLTGSTRLKAATAQKLALNCISTAAMVLCGRVIENLMVDVLPKNLKLKERCTRIVRELTVATEEEAWELLEKNDWNVRKVVQILRSMGTVQA